MNIGELTITTVNKNDEVNDVCKKIVKEIEKSTVLNLGTIQTSSVGGQYVANGAIELRTNTENFCTIEKEIKNILKDFGNSCILDINYTNSYLIKRDVLLGSKEELVKTILGIKYPKVTIFKEDNYTLRICGAMEVKFSKETLMILDENENILRTTHLEDCEFYRLYAKVLEMKSNR